MNNLCEDKIAIGHYGEKIAKDYLRKKGYKIIDCNWRTRWGEIDLIASYKRRLRFIEVRTRKGERFGSPEDSINREKSDKMIKNAESYTALKNYKLDYFLECICVVLEKDGSVSRITHYDEI